jgi:DNA-binding XRE family transcriptional regulator
MVALIPLLVDNVAMNIYLDISKKVGTQEKAARMLGVSTSAYSTWVVGGKIPSVKNANKLKDIFGVTFDEIFSSSKGLENK